jgi:beta-glucosidase-like glycosyl hydrolase
MRLTVLLLVVVALGASAGSSSARRSSEPSATLAELVGQRPGCRHTRADAEVGPVGQSARGHGRRCILFGGNVRGGAQVRALTQALFAAAHARGQPRLLIAVDQEGGVTRRLVGRRRFGLRRCSVG